MEKITICVGLRNRMEHLIEDLVCSMNNCKYFEKLELSVFDCNSDDVDNVKDTICRYWKREVYFEQQYIDFSRSYTFNRAVKNSKTDYVFLCDADMSLPFDFVEQFFSNVSNNKIWFPICFSLLKGKPMIVDDNNGWWRENGFGMVGIFKNNFYKYGMLNEKFSDWGGEDNDFYNRIPENIRARSKCYGFFHHWHCSLYNMRTTPEKFRNNISELDVCRPIYVLAITTFNRLEYLKNCIETWIKTKNEYAEWILIVADDGSNDGTLEYLENLNLLIKKVIIKNNRNGIHHQVNQIIKYLDGKKFDVCFKCDDDIEFLKKGWDDDYFLSIKKYKTEHLVFHDESWIGGRYKFKHRIERGELLSRVDALNTQGGFYTITPTIIEKVGYFDLKSFGLCGLGHVDFTLRCCRAGFNKESSVFDLKDSNKYLKYLVKNYHEAPNEFRHVENTPKKLKLKQQRLNDKKRIYISYNELDKRLIKTKCKIVYLLPSSKISGGVAVIVKHANLLLNQGYHVFLLSINENEKNWIQWTDNIVPIFSIKTIGKHLLEDIDVLVMTYWGTVGAAQTIKAKRKIYFVQSDERRFYTDKQKIKEVHDTYRPEFQYMTEAKWIQKWLKTEFGYDSFYVPNGIDLEVFHKVAGTRKTKHRVLLEGALTLPFKGVNDAYQVVKDLNCEIWVVSNDGIPPKSWKKVTFFKSLPMDKMKEIYSSCDVLLKMSRVEGFFGPPMEAMACGCAVVVAKCTGYDEYIEHNKNALVVETGDIAGATSAVKTLFENVRLRNKLIQNGLETVKQWTWDKTLNSLELIMQTEKNEKANINEIKNLYEKAINNTSTNDYCEIIIVVHNALAYIERCIESIKNYTNYPYRITIVDNCSNYETKTYLRSLKNVKIITNEKNFGFGYANNQAIRQTDAKYICFLNSDTIVTKNWLSRLVKGLEQNKAGIVGPVSNSVSSEIQLVDFKYVHPVDCNDDSKIQIFSEQNYNKFLEKAVETSRLIGFCMVTKKEILDKSGIFDDRYKFNFEDDDLGLSVIEQGYRLYCLSGVFVYHFGGQTFKDRFKSETHLEFLEKSKKLYVEKWYKTSRINFLHDKHYKSSIIYIIASNAPSGGVKIIFEQANRLKDRGYNISIYCYKNELSNWFDLHVPIHYFSCDNDIPETDIAIGTYFTTLPFLQKCKAKVKIHFCQGYEVLLYENEPRFTPLVSTIKDDYKKIKDKIVVSKWLKTMIDSEYNIDSIYVPNGIDDYVFSFSKHERNPIPRILIVGNYNLEFKGVKLAIEAISEFLKTEKGMIVRLGSDKTKFDLGYEFHDMSTMTQVDIANVYASCDITINAPYRVEGFSLPPLESMASGTPVITTDCGGVMDYVVNSENALVVSPKNKVAIQRAVKFLISNSNLYSRFVENGLKTAYDYIWYSRIDMLESVLDKLYLNYLGSKKENLSVCMIVKNEEDCLGKCLESIKEIASEIIIVDTGSSDNTIKIAKEFGAKIYHFEWINDFSAARNFSLKKATQPWTLILDADELISIKDLSIIREMLKGPEMAYAFVTRNYVKTRDAENITINKNEYENEEVGYIGWCRSDKVRLFPTNSEICFSGQVHELVEPSIKNLNIKIELSTVPIHHYSKFNSRKNETYLELGKEKAFSGDPKALFELATQYMVLNNYDEAIVIWRKLLELNNKDADVLSRLATTFNLLGDYKQAEKYFLQSIDLCETEYALKHLGICYAKQDKYVDAYSIFRKIVYKTEDLKTMTDFAFCCNTLKKFDESIVILEKCLKLNRKDTVSTGLLEIAYNEKGIELANKNNFLKSIVMFKSALAINPNFDIAKSNLSAINKVIESKQFSKRFIN